MDCENADMAFKGYTSLWLNMRLDQMGAAIAPLVDTAGQFDQDGQVFIERSWVQGASYMHVARRCPPGRTEPCVAGTAGDARTLAELQPGKPVQDLRAFAMAGSLALSLLGTPC